MKKLLIMGDYFYPDVAATGQLLTEMCIELQFDFNITVLTSISSLKPSDYTAQINYEKFHNVNLVRIKTKPFLKNKILSRLMHVIEYFRLCRKAIRKIGRQDIIYSISQPPILGGLMGLYAKKLCKGKLIYSIHDFNPEQAKAVGYLGNSILFRLIRWIDSRTCCKADKLHLIVRDQKETLVKRKIYKEEKVQVIHNWVDETELYPINDERVREFKSRYGLLDKTVIMYSGNIGLYYDLENIIKVFGRFKDRRDIVFAFVGDGAKSEEIKTWVGEKAIENIIFIPFQEKQNLLYSLNAADIHLVANKKGIKGVSMPSKLLGVMAVGKYVLGILEQGSEACELIKQSGCGTVVEPEAYEEMYETLKNLLNTDKSLIMRGGMLGRKYLERNLLKAQVMQKFRELFNSL